MATAHEMLNVQGVPMSRALIKVFTPWAVSEAGYIRDEELYEYIYEENVLALPRYHWLMENLDERVRVYRMLVGLLIQGGEIKDGLSNAFLENLDLLRPSRCLSTYLAYQSELIEYYPSVNRGKVVYDDLADDLTHYEYLFPNTGLKEMSQIIRGASWVSPENWGAP